MLFEADCPLPHITCQLSAGGPIIDLLIGISAPRVEALHRAGRQVPALIPVRGLIDTGASATCVDPTVVKPLGIQPTGQTTILTPSTGSAPHACDQYDVSLHLIHPSMRRIFGTLPVILSDLSFHNIEVLIGRDVLGICLLVYDGQARTVSLAF